MLQQEDNKIYSKYHVIKVYYNLFDFTGLHNV